MNSLIIVELIKGSAPLWPRLENDDFWMVVGSSRPMEDSWRIAQLEMVTWFTEMFDLHPMDAYQLLTQTSLAPIANAVDANYSVVVKVAKSLMPPGVAYDGLHHELRSAAHKLR